MSGMEEQFAINMQDFLDNAPNGVIYVKVGKNLSRRIQMEMIETFRSMNQKFVWEHEQNLEYILPPNIFSHMNLQIKLILSHKNTILFITNDDAVAMKQALHYDVPMLIVPFQNMELHTIIESTALENIFTLRVDEINKDILSQKIRIILNSKSHAKEILSMLRHNSAHPSNSFVLGKEDKHKTQTLRQVSTTHLHLDALGALFFVILVIVKLSLKFCRFYNNLEWKPNATTKKTK